MARLEIIIVETIVGTQEVKQSLDSLTTAIEKQTNAVKKQKAPLAQAESQFSKFNRGIGILKNSLGALAGAFIAFRTAADFAEQGAQITQAAESFDLLIERLDLAPDLLDQLAEAGGRTVTTFEAIASTNKLLAGTSGELATALGNAAPQLLEISRAAVKLDPTIGSVDFVFNSLAKGIKKAQPLLIDNANIILKVGEANEKLAQELGKSTDDLTAQERSMAVLNETLRGGSALIEQVGGDVSSQADAWARLRVEIEETTNEFKQTLDDGLSPIVEGFFRLKDRLEEIEELTTSDVVLGPLLTDTEKLIIQFGDFSGTAEDLENSLKGVLGESVNVEGEWISLGDELVALVGDVENLNTVYLEQQQALVTQQQALQASAFDQKFFNDVIKEAEPAVVDLDAVQRTLNRAIVEFGSQIGPTTRELEEMAFAEMEVGEAAAGMGTELKRQREELEKNQKALGGFFVAALNAEKGSGLFEQSLSNLGEQFVTFGGRTGEQNEDLNRLQGAYDKVTREIRDYEIGLKTAGDSTEDTNEKIALLQEEATRLTLAMEPLVGITGEVARTQVEATISMEAVNQALFEQAQAAGADEQELAALGVALGILTPEQAAAAVQAAILTQQIIELAEAFNNGDISADRAQEAARGLASGLFETTEEALAAAAAADLLNEQMDMIDREVTARINIEVNGLERFLAAQRAASSPFMTEQFPGVPNEPFPMGGGGTTGGAGDVSPAPNVPSPSPGAPQRGFAEGTDGATQQGDTFNVNAAPGMNEQDLANKVAAILGRRTTQNRAAAVGR